MIKKIIILLIFVFSWSSNLQITSKDFKYDKITNISYFSKDVNITKEKDNITTDSLTVYFNKNKKIDKMIAKGNVKFLIHDKNSTYNGNSDIFTYIAPKELFIFKGNVHIVKVEDNQQLFGNRIIINKKTGEAKVFGQKTKPVKFILKVND
jgi:lipopolysaccharide export system protein LptA